MTLLHTLDLAELSVGLANKDFSSRELTQYFLTRIENIDPKLNSFVTITGEQALRQADAADARRAQGENQRLLGIPLAQKDIFCTEGVKTTCGSKMLANFTAPYNATVVEKLHQAHGMPMLGKTNMDEFAMGSSNETSFFGAVANPWDTTRVPGGSSGGSAAAVAAGLCPAATGTDTGGSIRQPAALCGITGIKPSYGRVSRYGMIAFASSLDQGGIFARSAADCALILEAMSGFDTRDSSSVHTPVPPYFDHLNQNNLKNLKIGLPKEYFAEGLDPKVRDAVLTAAKTYESLGAELVEITLPNTHLAVPTYYVVAPAEASSNLARFDGVRYGYRCENPKDLTDLYMRSRAEGFGREVQRRIMVGAYVLSAGYYDAYYLKAQQIRRLIAEDFTRAFTQVDVILGPTTTNTAFALGDKLDDPVAMYLNDLYTIPANLAGLPGMSLPCGFVDGLPVGMQLVGAYDGESQLLNMAHAYQQVTAFHRAMPAWVK